MGRHQKRKSFTTSDVNEIKKYLSRKTEHESVKDPNSMWGNISEKLFGSNNLTLRVRIKNKYYKLKKEEPGNLGHWFSSNEKSIHGRKYRKPFWAQRLSYEIGFRKIKKRRVMKCMTLDDGRNQENSDDDTDDRKQAEYSDEDDFGDRKLKEDSDDFDDRKHKKEDSSDDVGDRKLGEDSDDDFDDRKFKKEDSSEDVGDRKLEEESDDDFDDRKFKKEDSSEDVDDRKLEEDSNDDVDDRKLEEDRNDDDVDDRKLEENSNDDVDDRKLEEDSNDDVDDRKLEEDSNDDVDDRKLEEESDDNFYDRKLKEDSDDFINDKEQREISDYDNDYRKKEDSSGDNGYDREGQEDYVNVDVKMKKEYSSNDDENDDYEKKEENISDNGDDRKKEETYSDDGYDGDDDDDRVKEADSDDTKKGNKDRNDNGDKETEEEQDSWADGDHKKQKHYRVSDANDYFQEHEIDDNNNEIEECIETSNDKEKQENDKKIYEDKSVSKEDSDDIQTADFEKGYSFQAKQKASEGITSSEKKQKEHIEVEDLGSDISDAGDKFPPTKSRNIHDFTSEKFSRKESYEKSQKNGKHGVGSYYKDESKFESETYEEFKGELHSQAKMKESDTDNNMKCNSDRSDDFNEISNDDIESQKTDECKKSYFDMGKDELSFETDNSSTGYAEGVTKLEQFDIILNKEQWKEIKPTKMEPHKLRPNWTNLLSQKFNEIIPTCVPAFRYHNINKKERSRGTYFNAKALCKHDGCGVFKFVIAKKPKKSKDKDVVVKVNISQPIIKHKAKEKKKRKLTGKKREAMKNLLQTSKSSTLHYSLLGEMPKEEVSAGNYTKCQSKEVLRKLKSEWNVSDVLHNDTFTELTIVQEVLYDEDDDSKTVRGYIQEISYRPLIITLYKEESLEVARNEIRYGDGVFYLDATGGVVSKTQVSRTVFYYAMVVKAFDKGQPPVPVLEFLSDQHGTYFVVRPFLSFYAALKRFSPTYSQPKRVECDFSWVFIHTILLVFNKTSIEEYLKMSFSITRGDTVPRKHLTVVHLCATHVLKAVRDHIKDIVKDKEMRQLVIRVFALLQNSVYLQETVHIWKIVCTVFGNEYSSRPVLRAIEEMREMVLKASTEGIDDDLLCSEIPDDESEAEEVPVVGIRNASPFNRIFQRCMEQVIIEDQTCEDENEYYCIDVLKLLQKSYMPLVSLWSGLMLGDLSRHQQKSHEIDKVVLEETRDTNANVENWMKIMKVDTLGGKKKIRIGLFARHAHKTLKGRLREYLRGVDEAPKKRPLKKRKTMPKSEAPEVAEETWKKNTEKSGTTNKPFFYSPPKKFPSPKKGKKTPQVRKKKTTNKPYQRKGTSAKSENVQIPLVVSSGSESDALKNERFSQYIPKPQTDPVKGTKIEEEKGNNEMDDSDSLGKKMGKGSKKIGKGSKKMGKGSSSVPSSGKRKQFTIFEMRGFSAGLKKRPGIKNFGNTCWLISTLQGLAALKNTDPQGTDIISRNTRPVLQSLRKTTGSPKYVDIEELKEAINSDIPGLTIGRQHDAAHYLTHLINKSCEEDNTQMEIEVENILQCVTCKQSKSSKEQFGIVPIEIPIKDVVTVKDCLNEFQKQELLQGANAVFCDSCGEKTSQLKHYEISNAGNTCLILQLKRYVRGKTGRLYKRQTPVFIDRLITLGSRQMVIYKLVAVQMSL